MKMTTIAAVAALMTGLTSTPSLAWDVEEMNAHIEQTNFIVGEGRGWCSGTLISLEHKLLLTNHHCIEKLIRTKTKDVIGENGEVHKKSFQEINPVSVSQKSYDGHEVVGSASFMTEVEAYDETNDLALLKFRAESLPYNLEATIYDGEEPVMRGEEVTAVGNPHMLDASVSRGIIGSTNRLIQIGGEQVPYYQMDANIAGGSSGGALYNSDGELIGVPGAVTRDGSVSLAIPDTRIREFLTLNCYEEVWNKSDDVQTYDECMNPEDEEAEED